MIVREIDIDKECDAKLIESSEVVITGLLYTLSLLIAISGVYYVPKFVQQHLSYFEKNPNSNVFLVADKFAGRLNEVYWATVLFCSIADIICTAVHLKFN